MIKLNRLAVCAGVAMAVLVGANALIAHAARTTQRQLLLSTINTMSPPIDCLFLGNSLIEAGCDPAAFKASWPVQDKSPTALNLGLGATTPVEHFLILKQALQRPLNVRCLVYGFFDDQLNAPVHGSWADLVGNRAFSYYFPRDAASFYAPGSRFQEWQLRIIAKIPMFAERSSVWGKVELLRRRLQQIGMPHQAINRFGNVADFSSLEDKDVDSFNQRCNTIIRQQKGFSAPIREIIHIAQLRGIKVFLVEMPMPTAHRQTFYSSPAWKELRAYQQSLATQDQAVYIQASDWVKDDANFEDAIHLNPHGAELFGSQLAAALFQLLPAMNNRAAKPPQIQAVSVGDESRALQHPVSTSLAPLQLHTVTDSADKSNLSNNFPSHNNPSHASAPSTAAADTDAIGTGNTSPSTNLPKK
ncbi:MAG: hypothetical protein JWR26_384 [Pedosphaera sp.]|nr:hypothetical protein [Pedosphaera sp.]